MPDYTSKCLYMPEYAWIYLNLPRWLLFYVSPIQIYLNARLHKAVFLNRRNFSCYIWRPRGPGNVYLDIHLRMGRVGWGGRVGVGVSKNVSHHGWPTTKKQKKLFLKMLFPGNNIFIFVHTFQWKSLVFLFQIF